MYLFLAAEAGVFIDCSGSANEYKYKYVWMMSAVLVLVFCLLPPLAPPPVTAAPLLTKQFVLKPQVVAEADLALTVSPTRAPVAASDGLDNHNNHNNQQTNVLGR